MVYVLLVIWFSIGVVMCLVIMWVMFSLMFRKVVVVMISRFCGVWIRLKVMDEIRMVKRVGILCVISMGSIYL